MQKKRSMKLPDLLFPFEKRREMRYDMKKARVPAVVRSRAAERKRMIVFSVIVQGQEGIHARPASILVNEARKFRASSHLVNERKRADLKQIIDVMMMGVKKGTEVEVEVEGEDEEEAAEALKKVFSDI